MKIKCTYKDCFKHFETEQAMIRHKIKEPRHSYCKLCDIDCDDDMYFFIHQLASPAHVCCPVCALEFKTTSARDTHVETQHRAASNISCAGCQQKFISGSALMRHIEQDECPVIGVQDFQMQRAERQIQKDAWEAEVDPFGINPSTWDKKSAINTNASIDLLDTVPLYESGQSLNSVPRGPGSMASQAQFPPLPQSQVPKTATANPAPQQSGLGAKTSSNLIDLDEPAKAMSSLHISRPAWGFQQPVCQPGQYGNDGKVKGWLNTVNSIAEAPSDNVSEVASMYDKKLPSADVSDNVPPRTQALPSQTAPYQHIIHMPAHSVVSTNTQLDIEKYWDPIRQIYACPTIKCKRQFKTDADFRKHLLSSSHIGGQVTCPSCLKKFPSTAAWVAHTESASKRCDIRKSWNYNEVMREITGGVLGTQGFNENGAVKFVAPKIDEW